MVSNTANRGTLSRLMRYGNPMGRFGFIIINKEVVYYRRKRSVQKYDRIRKSLYDIEFWQHNIVK